MQNKLQISEIFYSIQGESTFAGLPCIFVRLSGCNLRCNYCDAAYTWETGDFLSINEIIALIAEYPCRLVEVTGGEPLMQQQCPELLHALVQKGYNVLLETNGSIPVNSVSEGVISIIDVKTPDSGSSGSFFIKNIHEIRKRITANPGSCEMKFVLSSKNDFRWACDFIKKHKLNDFLPLLFSPVTGCITPQELAEWLMETALSIRLQLQLHTLLWPGKTRGV